MQQDSQGVLRQRYLVQPTKKMDCPVVIHMKKLILFPQFKVSVKASLVALNRQSILGLIFTTVLRDLARFNVINWWANDSGVI